MPERQEGTAAATPVRPSPRLKSRLALGNRGNRPKPVALTESMTPAQAFVGPTLTPSDLDLHPDLDADDAREWDEVLEDAFFSDASLDADVEVDTFPPPELRTTQPVEPAVAEAVWEDEDEDLDDIADWVRPRSKWPARVFGVAAAALVIGLAGFGFGMALEAAKSDATIAFPSPEVVLDAPVAESPPEVLHEVPDARIYPLQAQPISAIGPTEDTPGTRTARRWSRKARRTAPSRRAAPRIAPSPPKQDEAPLSVRSLKPAVSVSALPPAE